MVGEPIATHHSGQGQQHLHFVTIHPAQQAIEQVAQQQAEDDPAAALPGQQQQAVVPCGDFSGLDHREGEGEEHDAHCVIEEGFAGDDVLQRLGHLGRFQDPGHRYGVGGRNQGAEDQAVGERQMEVHQGQDLPQGEADQKRRGRGAEDGQGSHRPFQPPQPGQIDMQCAGEKEERQHAPHQHPGEIHRGHHGLLVLAGRAQPEVIQADETEGDRHGDGHHADGGRQADHPVIDVGEQGGDDEAPDGDL